MKSDLLWFLREQRHIFMVCPCCGEVVRLSDARISYQLKYADDWLDRIERSEERVGRQIESFEERRKELRDRSVARARQRILPQLLRKVVPAVSSLKLSPMDVKTIMDPVGYVVFDGLNSARGCRRILFLDTEEASRERQRIRESIGRAIRRGDMGWTTVQIGQDGTIEVKG
jgi:predicted Holliday junction resolvase-like endonuclease